MTVSDPERHVVIQTLKTRLVELTKQLYAADGGKAASIVEMIAETEAALQSASGSIRTALFPEGSIGEQ